MLITSDWNVTNMDKAILGMRNPKDSWAKSDSYFKYVKRTMVGIDNNTKEPVPVDITDKVFVLGPNDLDLAKRLCKGGSVHRKFMRQIFVSFNVTAPLYLFKEFDTYKVATTANSCSTMHTITKKPITIDLISHDHLSGDQLMTMDVLMKAIEIERQKYLNEQDPVKKKEYWYNIIQMLPSSWNQMRTVTMNYETFFGILRDRKDHKLDEWHVLCDDIIKNCPYVKELILDTLEEEKLAKSNNTESSVADKSMNKYLQKLVSVYNFKYGPLSEDDFKDFSKNTKKEKDDKEIKILEEVVAIEPISSTRRADLSQEITQKLQEKNAHDIVEDNNESTTENKVIQMPDNGDTNKTE